MPTPAILDDPAHGKAAAQRPELTKQQGKCAPNVTVHTTPRVFASCGSSELRLRTVPRTQPHPETPFALPLPKHLPAPPPTTIRCFVTCSSQRCRPAFGDLPRGAGRARRVPPCSDRQQAGGHQSPFFIQIPCRHQPELFVKHSSLQRLRAALIELTPISQVSLNAKLMAPCVQTSWASIMK